MAFGANAIVNLFVYMRAAIFGYVIVFPTVIGTIYSDNHLVIE